MRRVTRVPTILGPVGGRDADFANVSLLLHMAGANGATAFVDSSVNAHAMTASGTAAVTTALAKFGGSAFAPGSGRLNAAHSAALDLSTGDFTIEGWFYSTTTSGAQIIIDKETGNGLYPWKISLSEVTTGKIMARRFDSAGTLLTDITGTTTFPVNTWNFFQFTRSGNLFSLWLNGVLEASRTDAVTLRAATDPINIGAHGLSGGQISGAIDEIRITKGVVRPSGVPARAFPG